MILQPRLWKHIDMRDVAIEIVKDYYIPEKDSYKMRVMWWNIGECHAPWCMVVSQRLTITRRDWEEKWKPYKYLGNRDRNGRQL